MIEEDVEADPIVCLNQAALRIRNQRILEGTTWRIQAGEHWAVVGPNGAGKSTLVRALTGEVPVVQGTISPDNPVRLRRQAAVVSFERHRGMMDREEQSDIHRFFSGDVDRGARVEDFFSLPGDFSRRRPALPPAFRIQHLMHRRIRELSDGEARRFHIALALASAPRLLILDEPFEGIDFNFRGELAELINDLMDSERAVVLVAHRRQEVLPNITHMLGVRKGAVVFQGRREDPAVQAGWEALYAVNVPPPVRLPLPIRPRPTPLSGPLIELHNVTVTHNGRPVFQNLSWTVRDGEHWSLCGPNGSGKTTLLRLIVGDHPQAYANSVRVFGQRRDSGAGIRELRRGTGLISAELQVRYRKPVTAEEAVLSGFFDSVGLYRQASRQQQDAARNLMESFGVLHLAHRKFNHLSHGEQRMVLLARSMIKPPRLLVLDEPCQGLDSGNRRLILQAVNRIAASGVTTVLYVSHHADEIPACITHRLCLTRSEAGPSRPVFFTED